MNEFYEAEILRAVRALAAARACLPQDPDSAASRAYYAAFHAVSACFARRGAYFKKHSALRAALNRDLINSGEWPQEIGRDFNYLSSLREIGDYGGIQRVDPEDAARAIACAEGVLRQAQTTDPAP